MGKAFFTDWQTLLLGAMAMAVTLSDVTAQPPSPPTTPPATPPATAPASPTQTPMTLSQRIGIDAAREIFGDRLPTGQGIVVGHVEAESDSQYAPNTQDNIFSGVTFEYKSGPSRPSGHAQSTAAILYGPSGLAPGVTQVKLFSTTHWLTHGGLNSGHPKPPLANGCRVLNHSWIAPGNQPALIDTLRRADALADQQNVIMVVGVNNGEKTLIPTLMASAYNVIAVGQVDGRSSGGYTQTEVAGRCKPDLVAPGNLTSHCTPVVTAVVARLLEAADRHPSPNAKKLPVIRAILMTGAEKPAGWHTEPSKPLDNRLGAGMVRLDRSLSILTAWPSSSCLSKEVSDPQSPSDQSEGKREKDTAKERGDGPVLGGGGGGGAADFRGGWDWQVYDSSHRRQIYPLTIDRQDSTLTATLCWNRRIDGRLVNLPPTNQRVWLNVPRLARFELRLWRIKSDGPPVLVAESVSSIDNVQHIHLTGLAAGEYGLAVSRVDAIAEPWDVAMAWMAIAR